MRLWLMVACAVMSPALSSAQVVTKCDWIGTAANIPEPWDENTRTFANGNIRVALVDTGGEPVCCSAHLMVLSPSGSGADEPAWRQCQLASARPSMGFFAVDIPGITATYDPARGLMLSVPVGHWHEGIEIGRPPIWERMEVTINQATGVVSAQ